MHSLKVHGATVEAALRQGAVELGVPLKRLAYEVLREGASGVMGVGRRDWQLLVYPAAEERQEDGAGGRRRLRGLRRGGDRPARRGLRAADPRGGVPEGDPPGGAGGAGDREAGPEPARPPRRAGLRRRPGGAGGQARRRGVHPRRPVRVQPGQPVHRPGGDRRAGDGRLPHGAAPGSRGAGPDLRRAARGPGLRGGSCSASRRTCLRRLVDYPRYNDPGAGGGGEEAGQRPQRRDPLQLQHRPLAPAS